MIERPARESNPAIRIRSPESGSAGQARSYRDRREYMRRYQREWVARRRAEFFADKVCVACGSSEDLELHHRDPAEKESHSIWSWSAERRDAELAKCEVRCAACHLDAHGKLHGTAKRYDLGCRCTCCVEAVGLIPLVPRALPSFPREGRAVSLPLDSFIVSHYELDGLREHWMPGNRRTGRLATEKRAFASLAEAEAFIADRPHLQGRTYRGAMGAYRCGVCGAFHIGRREREDARGE